MCSTCGCGLSREVEDAIRKASELMADVLAAASDLMPVPDDDLTPAPHVYRQAGTETIDPPAPGFGKDQREAVSLSVTFTKADINLRLGVIYGKASATRPDRQDDGIDLETMEQAAVDFMVLVNKGTGRATDTHTFGDIPGCWVASWIDADAGVWRVGFKPDDIEIAKAAARGEFVGFSIGGMADRIMDEASTEDPSPGSTSRDEIALATAKDEPNRARLVPQATGLLKAARPSRDVVSAAVGKAIARYRPQ